MSMNQMKTLLSCNIAPRASVLARMVMGLIGIAAASAWAQQSPSVKTGCNGQLSAEMTKIAAPYQKVAEAFKSTEKGWCALAVEVQKDDYISEPAALPMAWEFVSAAYVLHPHGIASPGLPRSRTPCANWHSRSAALTFPCARG